MSEYEGLGPYDLAKYPFLDITGKYVRDNIPFPVDSVMKDPDMLNIVDMAYERITDALSLRPAKARVYRLPDHAILSFVTAMMMLKIVNIRYFMRRFALHEAMICEKYLIADLQNESNRYIIKYMLQKFFKCDIIGDGLDLLIPVPAYLSLSSQFNEKEWKLVNQRVFDGMVHVDRDSAVRLLRSDIEILLMKKMENLKVPPKVDGSYKNLEPYIEKLTSLGKKYNFEPTYTNSDIPPCIEDAMNVLKRHDNLSHTGRFMLATFMASRGMTESDIVDLFRTAPDFNERITRYQVHRIFETGYKCPGCDKLNTSGLCRRTFQCGNIRHPLQFRKRGTGKQA